ASVKAAALALALACSSLAGCEVLTAIGGAVAGAAAGGATANSAVGIATAIAVDSALNRAQRAGARRGEAAEQDAIAATAGETSVGETREWSMQHRFTRRKAHGEVKVTRIV